MVNIFTVFAIGILVRSFKQVCVFGFLSKGTSYYTNRKLDGNVDLPYRIYQLYNGDLGISIRREFSSNEFAIITRNIQHIRELFSEIAFKINRTNTISMISIYY